MSTTQELETLYPDGVPLKIAGEDFKIKPFVLKNRTKVVKIFTEVFAQLSQQGDISKSNNVDVISKFIETAGDRIIELYEIILDKNREWLDNNLRLKDEIILIKTVMEINDFPFLVSQVQAMMAQKQ